MCGPERAPHALQKAHAHVLERACTHLEVRQDEREPNHGRNRAVLLLGFSACAGELQDPDGHHHKHGQDVQNVPAEHGTARGRR